MAEGPNGSASVSLPPEMWSLVASYVNNLQSLYGCSHSLSAVCLGEVKSRVVKQLRLRELNSKLLRKQRSLIPFLSHPRAKCAVIPCISVSLEGTINAHLLFAQDGQFSQLETQFERIKMNELHCNYIFAVVSDHTIETSLRSTDVFRGALLKRCGVYAYETQETSNDLTMKRIEVRWRGIFRGKARLFGMPLIVYVPRIVDRNYVHQEVFKRVLPFLKNPASSAAPPYNIAAYNIKASGVANEVAFTPDYMVLDSQMHAMGERFCIVVDFGPSVKDIVQLDLFGEHVNYYEDSFAPSKSDKLVAALIERDCGVKIT